MSYLAWKCDTNPTESEEALLYEHGLDWLDAMFSYTDDDTQSKAAAFEWARQAKVICPSLDMRVQRVRACLCCPDDVYEEHTGDAI